MKRLIGVNALVSGASQGLGLAIASAFLKEGANVLMCARDAARLEAAQAELQYVLAPKQILMTMPCDIASHDAVAHMVTSGEKAFGYFDVLVANAAVHGPKGVVDEVSWDAWSHAIDVNLKGTVLQCRAVLPIFKKRGYGKIIVLSGGGATGPRPYLSAYAASKAAIVRFAETLAQEVKALHIDVNAIAPGSLNTRLLDDLLASGPQQIGQDAYKQALQQKADGGTPLTLATDLCVFLASSASDGLTGKLLSAVWDKWQKLMPYVDALNASDVYTLRRITPTDRQIIFGEDA